MSSKSETTNNKKAAKRTGLGRGLGSLLGGSEGSFGRDTDLSEHTPVKAQFESSKNPALKEGFSDTKSARPQASVPATAKAPQKVATTPSTQAAKATDSAKPPQKMAPKIPDHARIWQVPIDKLAGNPKQPRQNFAKEALSELSDSIKSKGILQPIVARRLPSGSFEIIAGERRWRAAQMAGVHQVPVILKQTGDQDALEFALIENIQREDLNPIEEAEAYAHLMKEYSLTQQQLAEKMGKERATVANVIRLLNLAPQVRQMVAENQISLGQAKVLLGVSDPQKQKALAEEIRKKKLTVRDTERLVAKTNKAAEATVAVGEKESPRVSDQLIKGLSQDLQKLLGTRVAIDYSGGKGRLKIHFYSDDDLNNIIDRIKESWQK